MLTTSSFHHLHINDSIELEFYDSRPRGSHFRVKRTQPRYLHTNGSKLSTDAFVENFKITVTIDIYYYRKLVTRILMKSFAYFHQSRTFPKVLTVAVHRDMEVRRGDCLTCRERIEKVSGGEMISPCGDGRG